VVEPTAERTQQHQFARTPTAAQSVQDRPKPADDGDLRNRPDFSVCNSPAEKARGSQRAHRTDDDHGSLRPERHLYDEAKRGPLDRAKFSAQQQGTTSQTTVATSAGHEDVSTATAIQPVADPASTPVATGLTPATAHRRRTKPSTKRPSSTATRPTPANQITGDTWRSSGRDGAT
jgi:hypothetical protein